MNLITITDTINAEILKGNAILDSTITTGKKIDIKEVNSRTNYEKKSRIHSSYSKKTARTMVVLSSTI